MNQILKFQDLTLEKINKLKWNKIEKKTSKTFLIPLSFLDDKQSLQLVFQTPKIFMPFNPQRGTRHLRLSFYNQELDQKTDIFYQFLKLFDDYLIKKPQLLKLKKLGINYRKRKYHTIINNSNYSDYFNLSLEPDTTPVYDQNKQEIKWTDLEDKMYGNFIFQITGIWITDEKYGYNLELKLARVTPPIKFEGYQFLEDDDDDYKDYPMSSIKNKPIVKLRDYKPLKQFTKMITVGVPLFAVKQKMESVGYDPKILDYSLDKSIYDIPELTEELENINESIPPPPPPPSFKGTSNLSICVDKGPEVNFLGSLGNLLGSQIKSLKETPKNMPKKKYQSHNRPVPSLDQIQNAMSNLRSRKQFLEPVDDTHNIDINNDQCKMNHILIEKQLVCDKIYKNEVDSNNYLSVYKKETIESKL